MLEWYELGHTYFDLMDSTEEMIRKAWQHVQEEQSIEPVTYITYQGEKIELQEKWYRYTVRELLKEHAGMDLDEIQELSAFQQKLKRSE
jgi:lysyl-tRNA synthetase class II